MDSCEVNNASAGSFSIMTNTWFVTPEREDGIVKFNWVKTKGLLAYSTLPRLTVYRGILCRGKPR